MRFLATAVRGTERILMEELIELGFEAPTMVPGGVVFTGTIADGMRSCLWLRTAQRVMARAEGEMTELRRSLAAAEAIIKAEPRPATYNEASFPSSPRPIQAAAL
jgi:23S rRNA G2445 N2-methylase RlmL